MDNRSIAKPAVRSRFFVLPLRQATRYAQLADRASGFHRLICANVTDSRFCDAMRSDGGFAVLRYTRLVVLRRLHRVSWPMDTNGWSPGSRRKPDKKSDCSTPMNGKRLDSSNVGSYDDGSSARSQIALRTARHTFLQKRCSKAWLPSMRRGT